MRDYGQEGQVRLYGKDYKKRMGKAGLFMQKVIVSLTSYPRRINTIYKVLDSIIQQTVLPDKIILYLSESEFRGFTDMPDLGKYEKYGFEIHWVEENMKSYKKWFYAFQEYPNDIIITIDDDILYRNTALENLLTYHRRFPEAVIARRVHLMTCRQDGSVAPYDEWFSECDMYQGVPRMDLMATGCGGILYPVHAFQSEIFNKSVFMEKSENADDIWMKIMEVYSGIPTVLAEKVWDDFVLMEHQTNSLWTDINSNGGNDRALELLVEKYPYTFDGKELVRTGIFGTGHTFNLEVESLEKQKKEKVYDELIGKMRDYNEILIYGAGMLGKQVCMFLKQNNIAGIKAFIVNNTRNNPASVADIVVKNYREFLNSDEKIVIALWDKNEVESVKGILIKEGVNSNRIFEFNNIEKKVVSEKNKIPFESAQYWEGRYLRGGNSGAGSYNRLAAFKAKIINEFVEKNGISKVVEWGCGDGNQLSLACYPHYVGFDVSKKAIEICESLFAGDNTKKFIFCGADDFASNIVGDLALSLDVIYHLIEDDVYEKYMQRLFASSSQYVCICSSNYDKIIAEHVKHREFTKWISQNAGNEWKMERFIKNEFPYSEEDGDNTSFSDFYFYKKSCSD